MNSNDLSLIFARHCAAAELAAYRDAAEHARHLCLDPTAPSPDRELAELIAQAACRSWQLCEAQCAVLEAHTPAARPALTLDTL